MQESLIILAILTAVIPIMIFIYKRTLRDYYLPDGEPVRPSENICAVLDVPYIPGQHPHQPLSDHLVKDLNGKTKRVAVPSKHHSGFSRQAGRPIYGHVPDEPDPVIAPYDFQPLLPDAVIRAEELAYDVVEGILDTSDRKPSSSWHPDPEPSPIQESARTYSQPDYTPPSSSYESSSSSSDSGSSYDSGSSSGDSW